MVKMEKNNRYHNFLSVMFQQHEMDIVLEAMRKKGKLNRSKFIRDIVLNAIQKDDY